MPLFTDARIPADQVLGKPKFMLILLAQKDSKWSQAIMYYYAASVGSADYDQPGFGL